MKRSFAALVLSAFLTGASLGTVGCALLDVPKNIVGGLQRTPATAYIPEPTESEKALAREMAARELAARNSELSEIRGVLDRMIQSGELTSNAAELKFLQERARIDSQIEQRRGFAEAQAQQRDLAAREMFQQSLNSIRATNCYSTGRGSTSCYSY